MAYSDQNPAAALEPAPSTGFGAGLKSTIRPSPQPALQPGLQPGMRPGDRTKARGAISNIPGRFETQHIDPYDDGWDIPPDDRLIRTNVTAETPQSAISRNQSPDLPFDRSINPYRGCEHGCIYCYARPSHAWLNMSPGLDFETQLIAKPGLGAVLDRELRAKSYRVAPIAIGTNTDPYQPIEAREKVMRQVLEVLSAFRHPLQLTTRGTLIERDIDLLAPMAAQGLLEVTITLTTLDPGLSRRMEPRAPLPSRRLAVIRRLSDAGIPVTVQMAPVIPGLTDPELYAILSAGQEAGAKTARWIMLRLPREVAPLFRDWLERAEPGRAAKIMARIREVQGGLDYDPSWGKRFKGQGLWANLINQRFQLALKRLGLVQKSPNLRCDLFAPPFARGAQLSLF